MKCSQLEQPAGLLVDAVTLDYVRRLIASTRQKAKLRPREIARPVDNIALVRANLFNANDTAKLTHIVSKMIFQYSRFPRLLIDASLPAEKDTDANIVQGCGVSKPGGGMGFGIGGASGTG